MEWSKRRQLIRNQNTQRTNERTGKHIKKGRLWEDTWECTSVYSVAVLLQHNTIKYRWIIHNVYNTLENSHILSTHKLVLAAERTEDYKIHSCNPLYYEWP